MSIYSIDLAFKCFFSRSARRLTSVFYVGNRTKFARPVSSLTLSLSPRSFSSYPPFSHSLCFFLRLFALLSSLSAIGRIPSGACAAGRTVRIAVVISWDGRFVGARILYLNSVPRFSPSRLFVSSFTYGNEMSRSPFHEKTGNVSERADVSSNDARRRDASGRHALSHNRERTGDARVPRVCRTRLRAPSSLVNSCTCAASYFRAQVHAHVHLSATTTNSGLEFGDDPR